MIEKLSAEDVLSRYTNGERNFSWKDLSGLDPQGSDLRDANLFGANLSNSNLTDANLEGANLGQANLRNTVLRNANLRRVFLVGADLTGAEKMEAQLPPPPSAPLQAAPQIPPSAFSPYIRVPAEKSPGLAGFLEYAYPGVGLLYCDATKPGLWVLIGTTLASVIAGALFIASFILGVMISGAKTEDEARLFPGIFLSITMPLSLIWLIVRMIWAAKEARTYNERRLDMLRSLKAQFRASMDAQQTPG
jgi:hypothetical protein